MKPLALQPQPSTQMGNGNQTKFFTLKGTSMCRALMSLTVKNPISYRYFELIGNSKNTILVLLCFDLVFNDFKIYQ